MQNPLKSQNSFKLSLIVYIPANCHACRLKTSISCLWTNSSHLAENVSYYNSLNWHAFQKYVNSNQGEKPKVHVKWVNDDTFPKISDFWRSIWCLIIFLRTSELYICNVFGHLWKSSEIYRYDCVIFENPGTPKIKILRLWLRKSWQVYNRY